jgi:hypothetical protein
MDMLNKKNIVTLGLLLLSMPLWAVECYFTVAKSSCWLNYDVDVVLTDTLTSQITQTIHIPKGKLYNRAHFQCQPKQVFSAYSQFSPVVWESDKAKKYRAVRFWAMPLTEPQEGAVWSIEICYPTQFSDVPLPKSDQADCHCDFSSIEALKNPNVITDNNS